MARKQTKWELVHQFVHEVVDFSSQYGSESGTGFTAANVVGPCQVYPHYCDSSATCAFRTYGKWWHNSPSHLQPINLTLSDDNYTSEDYIDLFFDIPVIPMRLQIYETYNPGGIVRISACYRRQPDDGPINMRKLQWSTLWKLSDSNQDKCQLVQRQHVYDANHIQHQQPSNKLQLTYHPDNVCTTLACSSTTNFGKRYISDMHCYRFLPALEYGENTFTPEYSPQSRIFQPPLSNIQPYLTDLIRIEFDNTRCRYYTQIDAVRLSGWAELTVSTSRWPGQLEAPSSSVDCSSISVDQSNSRIENTLSTFSDLLRPCTPRLRASSYDLTNEPMDESFQDEISPESSSNQLIDEDTDENKSSDNLLPICIRRKSSGLIQIPPFGMNLLSLQSRNIVALPPGTICQSSLFGLTYLHEDALWRHGPLTRLPYEVLLHIFSYLDLRCLFRCACVSRQFRCLVEDTLANVTSINLQSFWPTLNDSTLINLGKRLGQVNLTARAVAEYYTSGQSLVAPITLLRRQYREEDDEGGNVDIENNYNVKQNDLSISDEHTSISHYATNHTKTRVHLPFATRVRNFSSIAERLRNHTRILHSIHSNVMDLSMSKKDFPTENSTVNHNGSDKITNDTEELQPTDELNQGNYLESPNSHLRRLDMSWCGNYSQISPTTFGHFLTDTCRYLITLRLSSCKFLNDDCLLYIVNTCPCIQELDLSSCLGITSYGFLTLGRLIHLQWISLYRTHINDNGLAILAELCQHLKHVNLGSCIDVSDMDHVLNTLTRNNPNLLSLNLWRCNSLTAIGISFISEYCLQLNELDIGWCRNIVLTQQSNCIVHLVSRVKHLKKLFLTGTNLLNSEELLLISQYLSATLEQLDIHGSTNITSSAIASLLNQCEQLKLLDVSFCPEIHSGSLIQLRYLFPLCTIIDSVPDMNAEILGGINQFPEMIIDEVDDIDEEDILRNRQEPLALPAPNPL
ncbi:F-box/LRR-repeat protein 2 [Schistosoma japonicum]|nr:F-box/LRR-repeat protein 2 [Schistosoma japonicum]